MSPIWIIEDHRRLRETVREALELAGEESVATFPSCEKALAALDAAAPSPGVILLDLGLPGMSGLEGLRRFKQRIPEAEIIVFTVCDDRDLVFDAICNGASGYLLKSEPVETLVRAVEEVREGGSPMHPQVARKVLDRFSGRRPAPESILSERERGVLQAMADGLTKKEIAARLDLSVHTVDNYLRRIYRKLHVNTLQGAVAKAFKDGLL